MIPVFHHYPTPLPNWNRKGNRKKGLGYDKICAYKICVEFVKGSALAIRAN